MRDQLVQTVVHQGVIYRFVGSMKSNGSKLVVPHFLFPDDTLGCVASKLCANIPNLRPPVYIWARSTVSKSENQAPTFALNLLRGRQFVHRTEAMSAFSNISGGIDLHLPKGHEMLNVLDVAASVPRIWSQLDEPGSVKHFNNTFPLYLPVDPGRLTHSQIHQMQRDVYVLDNSSATLESLGNGGDIELHVIDKNTVLEQLAAQPVALKDQILHIYFPESLGKQRNWDRQNDQLIADALYSQSKQGIPGFRFESYLLKLALLHNQHALGQDIDLAAVLDRLQLSSSLPFAYLRNYTQGNANLYKIHRRSFSLDGSVRGTVPVTLLRSWIDECKKQAAAESTLIVYMRTEFGVYCSIQVSPLQAAEIHFRMDSTQSIHMPVIAKCLDGINATLSILKDAGLDALLKIDQSFLLGTEEGQTFSARYGATLSSSHKTPHLHQLESIVRSRLAPIFFVIPQRRGSQNNSLTLQYKRYDNYNEIDAIRLFIDNLTQRGEDPSSWGGIVGAAFNLDKEAAQEAIDDWRTQSEMMKFGRRLHFRYGQGLYIDITRSSDVGITYTVSGITRWKQARRIDCAMQHLLLENSGTNLTHSAPTNSADNDLLSELRQELLVPNANTFGGPGNGFLLHSLKKADEKLFTSGFSSMCTATAKRQPVVVSEAEFFTTRKMYPGSVTTHVQTGSTPELAKLNYYICPYVWCPKSRIALSKSQFENSGKRCPIKDVEETPLVMDSPYFKGQPHHAQLLDSSKHPDGLLMPCCFKHNKEDSGDNKPGYIQTYKFPAPPDRFAVLPTSLITMLSGRQCGSRPDGSGNLIQGKQKCFVRLGMLPNDQPFLQCVAHLWKMTVEGLLHHLLNHLDMMIFLSLDGGAICRSFLGVSTCSFNDFSAWFVLQKEYITRFGLQHLVQQVTKPRAPHSDDLYREYAWYASLCAYRVYLEDASALKTPSMVMDLIMRTRNATLLLFNINEDNSVVLPCGNNQRSSGTFYMIVRKGMVFEPIYQLELGAAPIAKHKLPIIVAVQSKYCVTKSPKQYVAWALHRDPSSEITQILNAHLELVGVSVQRKQIIPYSKTQWGFEPTLPGSVRYAKDIPELKMESSLLDERISTKSPHYDKRSKWTAARELEQDVTRAAVHTLYQAITTAKEGAETLYFLRHPMNPLSEYQRCQILKNTVEKLVSPASLKYDAVRKVLLGNVAANSQAAVADDVTQTVLLTEDDVKHRSHTELFALIKTPYTTVDLDVGRISVDVSRKALDIPVHRGNDLPLNHFDFDKSWKVPHGWKFNSPLASSVFLSIAVAAVYPGIHLPTDRVITLEHIRVICKLFGIGIFCVPEDFKRVEMLHSLKDTFIVYWVESNTQLVGVLTTRKDELIWSMANIQQDLSPDSQYSRQGRTRIHSKSRPHY